MVLKRVLWLALLIVYPAFANTIIVTGVDSALGWQQSLYINENGSNDQLYWSGAIDITIDGWTRQVFCVDLFTDITFSTYDSTLDFSDTPSLKRVGWLLQNQFPVTQLAGAAFQLAIWDIVHDNGDGFAVGAGKVSQSTDAAHPTDAGVLAAAAQYEAVSVGKSSTLGIVYHNVTLSSGIPVQTLMGAQPSDAGPYPKTPEPAALLMIVSGLALIGLGRLRRGRR
jgi:hypothetical protein